MSRILLIDDEAAARLVLQNRLKDLGHDVILAENGAKGLLEAREGGFDLILIETGLGSGISGSDVCRRIKQIPQSSLTPVVMIARSTATRDDVHQAYEAGCDVFLQKADMVVFEDVMRSMLRIKSQHDEFGRQLRAVEAELRRKNEERQHASDRDAARGDGEHVLQMRELCAGKPDGVLLVDADGIVRYADRGARELLGSNLETKNLGRIAPNTRLEAFVRDAHTEGREGYRFDVRPSGTRAARSLSASVVPLVANPGEKDPGLRVVMLLDSGKRRVATELLRLQEYSIPRREVGVLLDAARRAFCPANLVGNSASMRGARATIAEIAHSCEPVLLCGEAGTGKQLAARALHFSSSLTGPFLPLSCAALSAPNLENELFGQVRGASPEATCDRPGLFQQANHGTIYLSEVDQLPVELQRKLLRCLVEGEVQRVGTEKCERVEARVIASTRSDLAGLVARGSFLRDLFDVLGQRVVVLHPLRDRREDIPRLAQHFLERFGASRNDLELSDEVLLALESYDWPGNVRELETAIERACASCQGGVIHPTNLPVPLREHASRVPTRDLTPSPRGRVAIGGVQPVATITPTNAMHSELGATSRNLQSWDIAEDEPVSLDLYEKKCLLRALHETQNDKLAAARLLKVGKSTLYRKLKRFGIT